MVGIVGMKALDSVALGAAHSPSRYRRCPLGHLGVTLGRVTGIGGIEAGPERCIGPGPTLSRPNPSGPLDPSHPGDGQRAREPITRGEGGAVLQQRWHPDHHGKTEVTSHHDVRFRPRRPLELSRDYRTVFHSRIMRTAIKDRDRVP
jgi:hypothetical protein